MQFAVTVVTIAVIKAVFSSSDRPKRQATDYAPPYNQPGQSYPAPERPAVQPMPKSRQHLTLDQIVDLHGEALVRRPNMEMSVQEFSRYMQANQSDYDFSEGIAYSPPLYKQPEPEPPQVASAPIFKQSAALNNLASATGETVASSKSTMDSTKKSEVALVKTGDSVSPTPNSHGRDFFTVGSTKENVLAVQGTPDRFTDTSFAYGTSDVFLRTGE